MSKSNILKGGYVVLDKTDKVIIDNNEAIEKLLVEMTAQMQAQEDPEDFEAGFVAGIDASQVARLVEEEGEAEPGNVIGEDALSSGGRMEALMQEQAKLREEAEAELAQMRAEAEQEIETMRAQAQEQGYQEGYSEGKQKAEEECRTHYEAMEQKLLQKEKELENQYQKQVEELEPALVDKLTDVYEHVLGIRLKEDRDNILFLIKRSLATQDSGRNYIIHVSKEEYDTVKADKAQISTETGMPEDAFEVIADGTIKKGDCLIESELGIMDCGLGTQMELLKRQLKMLSFHM